MSMALKVVEGTKPSALAGLVEEYLDTGVKWSRRTRDQYEYNLTRVFLRWAEQAKLTEPEQLDERSLDRLHRHLADRVKPATVHSYLRSVNQFLNWARKRGDVGEARAKLPALKRTMIEVLSRDEIARMEAACDAERDKLIIRTLADGGLRLNETLGLRTND